MMDFPSLQMIAVNGVELEVFTAGTGAIVLSHGWPEHAFSWRHQIQPLVDAGYHVIVPNQQGYGHSTKPADVTDYAIEHLTGDLIGLLDHYGYDDACFIGHDWGAIIVWNLAMMYRERYLGVINLSVPFMERGDTRSGLDSGKKCSAQTFTWCTLTANLAWLTRCLQTTSKQFANMYRTNIGGTRSWISATSMNMINMAQDPALADGVPGDPIMSDAELQVFLDAFALSGFTGGISWYRNLSRNWKTMGAYGSTSTSPHWRSSATTTWCLNPKRWQNG